MGSCFSTNVYEVDIKNRHGSHRREKSTAEKFAEFNRPDCPKTPKMKVRRIQEAWIEPPK
jgi:hypothetical protein